MAQDKQTEFQPEEIDTFLAGHETGVLALARDDEPYAVPISYGYDADTRRFYLRLVSSPGSQKRQFLSSVPEAQLVVYGSEGDTYRSVVAAGTLEVIDRTDLTVEHVEQYGEARRPLFEMWGEGKPELDVQLYTLDPETLSGRRVEVDREPGPDANPD